MSPMPIIKLKKILSQLYKHKFWIESENRFITLKVSTKGMRIIDKKGIDEVLKDLRAKGTKI